MPSSIDYAVQFPKAAIGAGGGVILGGAEGVYRQFEKSYQGNKEISRSKDLRSAAWGGAYGLFFEVYDNTRGNEIDPEFLVAFGSTYLATYNATKYLLERFSESSLRDVREELEEEGMEDDEIDDLL